MQERGRVSCWTSCGPAMAKSLLLRPPTPIHETRRSPLVTSTHRKLSKQWTLPGRTMPRGFRPGVPDPLCFLLTLQSPLTRS